MAAVRGLAWGALALAVLVGLLALGLLLWPAPPPVPTPAASPAASAAAAAAPVPDLDLGARMQQAREHLARGALIASAGANAVETYLAVLQADPTHTAARAALIEMQPVVADGIRGALAGADWAEAERLLAVLRRLDPGSVLLDPLAAELAQRRNQAEAAETARLAATPPAPVPPAADRFPAPSPAPVAATPSASAGSAPSAGADIAAPAPVAPMPATPAPAPAVAPLADALAPPPARETPARLLNNPPVSYPPQARRQRLEGWVEVEVQIGADGAVAEARVLRAEPAGVFDREALRTAQRWRFAPREVDGRPVPSTARRRVAFSLGS